MMADDKVCLALDADGIVNVVPAYPELRLLEHAAATLNFHVIEARFVSEFAKFFVPIKDLHDQLAPLKKAYLLASNNQTDMKYVELKQFPEKYEILNSHVYLSAFVTKPLAKMTYFSVLSQAAKQISMTVTARPQAANMVKEVASKVAEDLAE